MEYLLIPQVEGGQTTIENGILLYPNRHAEIHAEILDINLALLKRGELLENPEKDNQQLSHESSCQNTVRVMESSTTSSRAKAVTEPRAPRSRRKTREEYLSEHPYLQDMI